MVDSVSGAWAALSSRVWSLAAKIVYLCVKTFMIAFRAAKCVFAFGEASQPTTIEGGRELTRAKYNFVASIYDVLDYPWEREYSTWRPSLAGDLEGEVLDLGVGTGRNLAHFPASARVTGIDLSAAMIRVAARKCLLGGGPATACSVAKLEVDDATDMQRTVRTGSIDNVLATFIFCVLPDVMQAKAIEEIARVLRPGGRFRLLEMVYSKDGATRSNQERWAPFVEWMYGARFDRNTLSHVKRHPALQVTGTYFIKSDTYLVIEGTRR